MWGGISRLRECNKYIYVSVDRNIHREAFK